MLLSMSCLFQIFLTRLNMETRRLMLPFQTSQIFLAHIPGTLEMEAREVPPPIHITFTRIQAGSQLNLSQLQHLAVSIALQKVFM